MPVALCTVDTVDTAEVKNYPPQIIDQYIASAKLTTMYRNTELAALISVHRDFT